MPAGLSRSALMAPKGAGLEAGAAIAADVLGEDRIRLQVGVGEDQGETLAGAEARGDEKAAHAGLAETGGLGGVGNVQNDVRRGFAGGDRASRGHAFLRVPEQRHGLEPERLDVAGHVIGGLGEKVVLQPGVAERAVGGAETRAFLHAAESATENAPAQDDHGAAFREDGARILVGGDAVEACDGGDADEVGAGLGGAVFEMSGEFGAVHGGRLRLKLRHCRIFYDINTL